MGFIAPHFILYTQPHKFKIMRNIPFFILLFLFPLISCEEDASAIEEMNALAAVNHLEAFDFELLTQACFVEKSLIILDIESPEKYSYLWVINELKGGHEQNPSQCYCGTKATVNVTRMEDGLRKEKSINLPACEGEAVENK